jgi:hypothetical protein
MTTLFGILAVILTIAIIFGRRVARIVVVVAILGCVLIALCAGAYVLHWKHLQKVREEHVEFAIAHLPAEIDDSNKDTLRKEFENYFEGFHDKQHVPDLDVIDPYLQKLDPSLVRHEP